MKHLTLKDFNRDNDHLFIEDGEAGFSAEKNYAVIHGTIAKYRKMRYGIDPKVAKAAGESADILASFAKYKLDIGGGKQLEEWLGRENLAKIYGEKLMSKIRVMDSVRQLNKARGNTKYGDHYLS